MQNEANEVTNMKAKSYQKNKKERLQRGSAVTFESRIEKKWSEKYCGAHKSTVITEVTQVRGGQGSVWN